MSEARLGRHLARRVPVPERYDPGVLDPVPRQMARDELGLASGQLPFVGEDVWHGWELSWLERDIPQVAVMRLAVPCTSPNLVESKSLKLYLNSLNQESFDGPADLSGRVQADLSAVAGEPVSVELLAPEDATLLPATPPGECIDGLEPGRTADAPEQGLIEWQRGEGRQSLYSHCLRSLCPVTAQPDWATVLVDIEGVVVEPSSLRGYLASFRQHRQFHEHFAERVFLDLWRRCEPADLSVQALFTRRGGLDINPYRSATRPRAPRLRTHRQ